MQDYIEDLLRDVALLTDNQRGFPYKGARLVQRADEAYEQFIPDLDLYLGDVAGFCAAGRRVLRWNANRIKDAEQCLQRSFFDVYPQYRDVQSRLADPALEDVRRTLDRSDRLRARMLDLLTAVQERDRK
jgi:hypothetical protein